MTNGHSSKSKRTMRGKALNFAIVYFALASLWIVLSGNVVDFMAGHYVHSDRIEIFKGLLFVLATSAALYAVLRSWAPEESNELDIATVHDLRHASKPSMPVPFLLLTCLVLIVIGGSYYVFNALKFNETQKIQQNLAAIGDLKADQINQWIDQNKINAIISSSASPIADRTLEWLKKGALPGADFDWLKFRLGSLRQIHSYGEMTILDVSGNVLVTSDSAPPDVTDLQPLMRQAIDARQALIGNMRWDTERDLRTKYISVPIASPLIASGENEQIVGVLLIQADANQFLFPLIQTWPTPSKTAETLLIMRDGNEVVYLNELRHQQNAALTLRFPLDDPSLLAAQAARGMLGFISGINYRGEPVIGYSLGIPGTNWLMVAEIDADEVFDPIRQLAFSVALITLLLVGIGGMSLFFWWRQRVAKYQTAQLQSELKQQLLAKQFDYLSKFANDIILLLDENGTIVEANDRAEIDYRLSRQELIGKNIRDLRVPQNQAAFESQWELVKKNKGLLFETVHRRSDGTEFPVEVNSRAIEMENRLFVQSIIRDITERKKREEEVKLAAMVYQGSSEGMMVTDAANMIVSVNPALEKITGYDAEDVIGKDPKILKSGQHDSAFYQAMWHEIDSTGCWKGELWNRKKNGDIFVVLSSINTIFNPDGSVQRRVALISDITEKKKSEELVWQQANFDALTGLPNRRLFRDHLLQEIRKARRANLPLAIMYLDLDGFKHVNDTLGHDMGDQLLKDTAERLKSCVRETDTVARLGGDEFIVLLAEVSNLRHVGSVAQNVLQKLAEPFQLGDKVAQVSASIGITLYPEDATEIEELLKNADQAMYAAKQEGRDRYRYFTESMQQAAQERMWLVNEMRQAIANQQFNLVYQPIVELPSGCINKAEALIRWRHPERGLIDPSVFIPIAEETGMIHDIGNWVFFEAANQARRWRNKHHPDFQISINKSPVQFRAKSNDLVLWFDHLKSLGLPGQSMAVEITEGLLMDAASHITDQLFAFRDAGIEVSLDDFGTGYSSLSYLKKFDIDRIKIDRTFILNLVEDANDMALCEAIIVMAHKLGIKVVAEGVETIEQRDLLAKAGCDFIQGYLIAAPLSADELENFLHVGASYCTEVFLQPVRPSPVSDDFNSMPSADPS